MKEQSIKITEVEDGYHGAIYIEDRIQTALFFSRKNWSKAQAIRRLSRYLIKDDD